MSSKYDFGGNGESRGYAPVLKFGPFIKMTGTLERMFSGGGDWGQSVGVQYSDSSLVDGIFTKRVDKDQYKVLGVNDAPVIIDETLTVDDIPDVMTETHGTDTYKYEVMAVRIEGDEETGYGDDAEIRKTDAPSGDTEWGSSDAIPIDRLMSPDDLGNPEDRFTIFEGASEYGPNSCAKTTVRMLAAGGENDLLDEDAQFGWMNEGVTLRPALEGMEIIYAKVQRDSDQSDNSYYHPIFIDAATGNQIFPDNDTSTSGNGGNNSAPEPDPEPATDGGDTAEPSAAGDDPVDEFYESCRDLNINTEAAVRGLLQDFITDDNYALTAEMVDPDDVVADLTE